MKICYAKSTSRRFLANHKGEAIFSHARKAFRLIKSIFKANRIFCSFVSLLLAKQFQCSPGFEVLYQTRKIFRPARITEK